MSIIWNANRYTAEDVTDARARLVKLIKPGQTVYVVQRHLSSSGMTRYLSLFVGEGRTITNITHLAAMVMGEHVHEAPDGSQALKIGGTGMDMHFHIVYGLGRTMYPRGVPCTGFGRPYRPETSRGGFGCLSNEHVNPGPERDSYVKGNRHTDGGYAYNHGTL